MKKTKTVHAIIDRLHYILLAVFAVASNIVSDKPFFRILIIVTLVYIGGFELYAAIKRKSARSLSESFIDLLDFNEQERLMAFPLPVVLADRKGDIIWYNDPFIKATDGADLSKFDSVFKLSKDIFSKRTVKVSFASKYFTVVTDKCKIRERELAVLYFFDITDYQQLQIKYNQQKPVIAHILVDNYDELFQISKESEKSTAMAVIDNALTEWAQSVGGIIRKTEKDSYLFIFRNEYIKQFTETRFDILDRVRNLQVATSVQPTISIGVGFGGATFAENEEHARIALDMTLSRGGDQAAMHSTKGFEFFGGLSKGVEKRTKIKSRVVASELKTLFKKVDTVLIMGHQFADFDCLGAAVGIARTALAAQKKVGIVYDPNSSLANALYERLLNESSDMKQAFVTPEQALIMASPTSVTVVVDTHRASMTAMPKLLEFSERVVVIDHHRKSADFIENAEIFFHEPYASSASEMVAEIMQYMNVNRMPAVEAEALMAGIYLDTKNFMIRTSLHTFEASSYLRKAGANTVNVKKLFQVDMQTYMQKTDMVQNAKVYRKIVAIACWEDKAGSQFRIASAQAADEMLNIEGVQASFTLFPDSTGAVIISGRSFGQVNVQLITEKLGGGGHQTMAGAQIKNSTPKEALDMLKKAIDEYIEESNILGTHS